MSVAENLGQIYNPLFIDKIESKKENIVLAVGRLNTLKGFDVLIKSFATLESSGWKLIIVGDGVEKESLLALIDKLNIKNIELIGRRRDVFEWYAKSSVFVLSSKREGFPNVLLEAMASGCAVVSFDCPYGPSEVIVHKKNGLLVKNQNREELAISMQLLMDNQTLREVLSKDAVNIKERFAMSKIAIEWEKIIEKVVSND